MYLIFVKFPIIYLIIWTCNIIYFHFNCNEFIILCDWRDRHKTKPNLKATSATPQCFILYKQYIHTSVCVCMHRYCSYVCACLKVCLYCWYHCFRFRVFFFLLFFILLLWSTTDKINRNEHTYELRMRFT